MISTIINLTLNMVQETYVPMYDACLPKQVFLNDKAGCFRIAVNFFAYFEQLLEKVAGSNCTHMTHAYRSARCTE